MSSSSTTPTNTPKRRGGKVDTAVAAAQTVVSIAAEAVGDVKVPALASALKALDIILTRVAECRDNKQTCLLLIQSVTALAGALQAAATSLRGDGSGPLLASAAVDPDTPGSVVELRQRIDRLQDRLNNVQIDAAKLQKQSLARRLFLSNRNAQVLREMRDTLTYALDEFKLRGQISLEVLLGQVHQHVEDVKARQAAEARDLQARQAAEDERRKDNDLRRALRDLPHADASFRAAVNERKSRFQSGTRVGLLQELQAWADSTDRLAAPFYILSGVAGTGKSTVAYEFSKRAAAANRLGASFFFVRGDAQLSSTHLVFPTVAFQLVKSIPLLRESAPAIVQKHLRTARLQVMDFQVQDLFVGLLSQLPADHAPILIVIDAVDECSEDAQPLVQSMLYLLADALDSIPCRIQILVTTRPELHIEEAFHGIKFQNKSSQFRLQDVPQPVIDSDIRLYLSTGLSTVQLSGTVSKLYPKLADDLTLQASGLFIYASLALEYIQMFQEDELVSALTVLIPDGLTDPRLAIQRLDDLYSLVLSTALKADLFNVPSVTQTIHDVLGSIAVLRDHVSPAALATILGISLQDNLHPILKRLASVVIFDPNDSNAAMRPLHASFAEFLVDAKRCKDPRFYVQPALQHCRFAEQCLTLLCQSSTLRRNICDLVDPSVFKHDIPDLHERVVRSLPAPVQYACT
ncbi:hypothetical protein EXIGLDRAFT_835701 [Exidia glandulosa HHB12029]|uniref:Nephrocystin 3-like N-terminal domain-containing protein n=1 Tax=Exidia glandulosa HHB12029 TaxID=1314781 RepID=A0A165IHA0_EXIGL|nr:hypothetical protein EXIGLDRAFT_835701 [Exidia glandulosa HHB12029]